jgi:hypothetical protein
MSMVEPEAVLISALPTEAAAIELSMPEPATNDEVVVEPTTNDEVVALPEESMSMSVPAVPATLPEDEVVVEEVLWASLSIPAIYEEIYGSPAVTLVLDSSMSMSVPMEEVVNVMPEGWTPADAGYTESSTGEGWVAPPSEDEGSDDPTDGVTSEDVESESDDVTDERDSAAAGAMISGAVSAACVVGALALF